MATIHNYSYKPNIILFLMGDEREDTTFTFGFELEVVYHGDNLSRFIENEMEQKCRELFGTNYTQKNLLYFKKDGSIGSNGFEIVSQPMSFQWFLEHKIQFKELLDYLSANECDSHENAMCGLHFHIGNKRLEKNRLNSMDTRNRGEQLNLVATNMDMIINFFKNELLIVSRRKKEQLRWARFSDEDTTTNASDFKDKETVYKESKQFVNRALKSEVHSLRYRALNIVNTSTLEFRLLRGTLNYKTFYISFNLINNLAKFSCCESKAVSWETLFYSGLDEEMKEYAKEYFTKQQSYKRNENRPLRKGAIFTKSNKAVDAMILNRKLEEMGLM